MPPFRLVADANMPHAEAALGRFGVVERVPGRRITRAALASADALFVRSVTRVDAALLEGTPVRFVGSATAGTDHVDAAWLEARGIAFAAAPGSNAAAVVDYVLAALLATLVLRGEGLAHRDGRPRMLGVVGVGAVGGRLARRAEALGLRVLRCDPPLAERLRAAGRPGEAARFASLAEVLREADVVSLHTPLTAGGPYPTRGLVDARALAAMRSDAWLVNAARGGVVEGAALGRALTAGTLAEAILDVWEGEPAPDPALVRAARLATPHVAGYAYDSKVDGTRMVADAFAAWLAAQGHPATPWDTGPALACVPPPAVVPPPPPDAPPGAPEAAAWLDALVRQAYDVRADDARFRAAMLGAPNAAARADAFTALRAHYPERRLLARVPLDEAVVPPALRRAVREGLGFAVPSEPAPGHRAAQAP
ncbi:MAG: 4-phosphoerythronate dehydrogenase [Rubricoccaceae bacterium]